MPGTHLIHKYMMAEYLEFSARHLTQDIEYQAYLEQGLFHALGALDDDQKTAVLDLMPIDAKCLTTLPTK